MRAVRYPLFGLALVLFPALASAQVGTVSGRVTEARTGEGLPGASLLLQGTSIGAASDIDGNYRFSAPPGTYTLVVSSVGFRRAERAVTVTTGATVTADFAVEEDAVGLDEVIVTGYTSQERRNLSTSITSVNGDELRSLPPISADAALQGRAAGVTVLQSSGTPGGGVSVRVRGGTSVSGSNQPLYVVDGVPVSSGNFAQLGAGNQGLNALATLDPADIADIQVLKDAAATALYGTRAANGVVLITTRRGISGSTQIEVESSLGSVAFPQTPDLLDGNEYVIVQRQAYRNQGSPYPTAASTTAGYLPTDTLNNPTTDYWDAVTQTGLVQTYKVGISGGTQRTRYRLSGNYSDEQGALIRSGYERYNGQVNVDHRWSERGTLFAKASYNRGTSRRVGNDNYIYGVLTNALLSKPFRPIFLDDGVTYSTLGAAFSNPVAEAQTIFSGVDTKFLGNVDVGYEVVRGLVGRVSAGLDRFDLKEDRYAPSFTTQGAPFGAGVSGTTFYQNVILTGTLAYTPRLGPAHDLQTLVGTSVEDTRTEQINATANTFPLDETYRLQSASNVTGAQTTATRSGLRSFFGNADYALFNRYLATASVRVDGSSRFGANNRYGVFPAVSLGWNINEERFLRNVEAVDQLKLRGSYGITGQQEIGNFTRLGLFGTGGQYAGTPVLAPTQIANPDLQWEETTQLSGGLDFVLFNARVGGTIEAYRKQTDDLLLAALLPLSTGYASVQQNIGTIRNSGLEFQLNTRNLDRGGFRWETVFNIATNRNKVIKLFDGNADGKGDPIDAGFASRLEEGQSVGAFYGYVVDGLYQSVDQICGRGATETAAAAAARCLAAGKVFQNGLLRADGSLNPGFTYLGDRIFRDLNGDGQITADDRTFIGDPNPDFFGGFTNTFSFRGLELSAFLQFSVGNDVYNNSAAFLEQSYRTSGKLLDAWTPENTDTDVARVTVSNQNTNSRNSSYFVEDGSYVRLKTLQLAYAVPTRFTRMASLEGLRLYFIGQNLWTSTKYSGLDPEVSTFDRSNTAFGTDFFTFPQATTITFGARVTL